MKNLKLVAVLILLVCAAPLVASPINAFVQIPGTTGDSKDAAHAGWFDVIYTMWGSEAQGNASPKGNYICHTRDLKFVTVLYSQPPAGGTKMWQMCQAHAPVPFLSIDDHGTHHMLQNVLFRSCKANNFGESPNKTEEFTIGFDHCTIHTVSPAVPLVNAIAFANAQVLVAPAATGQSLHLVSLHYLGLTGTVILQSDPRGTTTFFHQAFQSKQKTPSVVVKAGGMVWTFTDLLVSGYQKGADGNETFNLTFTKADGPPAGYQKP